MTRVHQPWRCTCRRRHSVLRREDAARAGAAPGAGTGEGGGGRVPGRGFYRRFRPRVSLVPTVSVGRVGRLVKLSLAASFHAQVRPGRINRRGRKQEEVKRWQRLRPEGAPAGASAIACAAAAAAAASSCATPAPPAAPGRAGAAAARGGGGRCSGGRCVRAPRVRPCILCTRTALPPAQSSAATVPQTAATRHLRLAQWGLVGAAERRGERALASRRCSSSSRRSRRPTSHTRRLSRRLLLLPWQAGAPCCRCRLLQAGPSLP